MRFDHGALPAALPLHDEAKVRALVAAGIPNLRAGLGGRVLDTVAFYVEALTPYPKLREWVMINLVDTQGPLDAAEVAWLRTRKEIAQDRIGITGSGAGAIVALHVAAIDRDIAAVVALDGLSSFRSLIAAERYPWPADVFLPHVLRHYDLPELAAAIPAPVHAHNLRDGTGTEADDVGLAPWRKAGNVTVTHVAEPFDLAEWIGTVFECAVIERILRHLGLWDQGVRVSPREPRLRLPNGSLSPGWMTPCRGSCPLHPGFATFSPMEALVQDGLNRRVPVPPESDFLSVEDILSWKREVV